MNIEAFSITPIIYIVLGILFISGSFFVVKQKTATIIERFCKFQRVATAGFNLKIPIIDKKAGSVNLKVMELPVDVETKTKDDVFVKLKISVQFQVIAIKVYDAFYKL